MKSANSVPSLFCSSLYRGSAHSELERGGAAKLLPQELHSVSPHQAARASVSIWCISIDFVSSGIRKPKRPRKAITLNVKVDTIKHFDRGEQNKDIN